MPLGSSLQGSLRIGTYLRRALEIEPMSHAGLQTNAPFLSVLDQMQCRND